MNICKVCGAGLSCDSKDDMCKRCEGLKDEVLKHIKWQRRLVYIGLSTALLCIFLSIFLENILILWWGVLGSLLLVFTSFISLPETIEGEMKKRSNKGQ